MLRVKPISFLLALAVPLALAAPLVAAPSTALAEETAKAPAPRATFSTTFQRYLLSPDGRPMGLLMTDGTFVATPGHSMAKDAPVLATGTKLEVDGVLKRTATGAVVHRAVVKANGGVIADASKARGRHAHRGKGHHEGKERHGKQRAELKPVSGAGQIAAIVSSPKGRVHAFVLTDGTTAVAHGLETLGLKVGDRVSVAGVGGVYPLGKALRIEKITLPNGQTRDIPRPVRPAPEGQNPA